MEKGKEMTTDKNVNNTLEATKETMKRNPKLRVSKSAKIKQLCAAEPRQNWRTEGRNAWWDRKPECTVVSAGSN